MADDLVLLDGSSFFVSDGAGDVEPTSGPGHSREVRGMFHSDVRHLARWVLLVNDRPMRVLTSRTVDYYSARIFGALGTGGQDPSLAIRRERIVTDGAHEDIWIDNNGGEPLNVSVRLLFDADFADLLDVKQNNPMHGRITATVSECAADLSYVNEGYHRGTRITFDQPGRLSDKEMCWELSLGPREGWHVRVDIHVVVDRHAIAMRAGNDRMGSLHPNMEMSLEEWVDSAPKLESDVDSLRYAYKQSLVNLAALRFRPAMNGGLSLPAAGLPWFMALFGRDSLITAYEALPFHPTLAEATLRALCALQAREYDDFRDAEPGKIPHELRNGEKSHLNQGPHTPYYGSHDATPLFLILLDEYERWTGDDALVRELEQSARDALAWIEGPGDRDGDGYLEYGTRSSAGLRSQCWKDSWNSVLFADGRLADLPIATCEIQGYAYDARVRAARLAREVWGDRDLADRLERDAAALRERFNRDFWIDQRGHYAMALDGEKNQVDAMTSNVGHLLWSGILDLDRVPAVVERLMGEDMWSGWGIRTMSTKDGGYNPIAYHNGTVWPHDNALIAEGMRRYGYDEQAAAVFGAMLDAAGYFDHLLPEVFAGYARADTSTPVEYPTACRPQAWAAGAPLLGLRSLLGLDVDGDGLSSSPHVPPSMGRVVLRDIPVRGQRVSAPY